MLEAKLGRSEAWLLASALVVASFLIAFGALHYGFYTRGLLEDTPIYERYGDAIVHAGKVPYRDFAVEYPPGSLPVFAAPSLGAPSGDFSRYRRLFEALMLLCGVAASALVAFVLTLEGAGLARLAAGTLLAGLAPLALGPVVLSRFDLWPAALAVAALSALVADRRRLGSALLGAAIAAKLYPAVLLPLALAYVWRRKGRREAGVCAAIAVAVVAACFLPFVVLSPSGVWSSLAGQATRPLQIESLGAAVLLAAHQAWGLSLTEVSSHGSDNLAGSLPRAIASVQSLLAVVALGSIWVCFARGEATRDRLLRYSAGAVCAFVALSRVLSPQYLIWLFALIPLVRGRRGLLAGGLFVAAMVVTQLWFPSHYISLVYGLDARASWFVFGRDLLLVALLVSLVWPARAARRAGATLVTVLVVGAAAAVGAGAVSSPSASVATHNGLLVETGVASRCGEAKPPPAVSNGRVAYETSTFVSPSSRRSCVTVALTTQRRSQLFSAAYRGRFDPGDPTAGYLGDAGRCTNVAGVAGPRVTYSVDVPAKAAVVFEVEDCGSAGIVPPYVLDIRSTRTAPIAYGSATARRTGGVVLVRWRTTRQPVGVAFAVYREQDGIMVAATSRPIRGAASRKTYSFADRHAPLIRPLRYWIRARTHAGLWTWHGPVTSNG
jgi:hypothetical protein